jgi:DNA-binding beta-propeller fold protein YncE
VAVDGAGDVYVADSQNHRVLELAAGASTQTELPFTGLSFLNCVAVDGAGDVYVTDYGKNRVLKLPPAYVFSFYHSWCRFSPTPCIVAPQSVSSAPLSANRVAIYPCFLGLVATGILGALGAAEPSSPNHSYRIDLDP